MTKEKFWFEMGRAAFLEGLSIEDAMPYNSYTMMFVQFCAGWDFEKNKLSAHTSPYVCLYCGAHISSKHMPWCKEKK